MSHLKFKQNLITFCLTFFVIFSAESAEWLQFANISELQTFYLIFQACSPCILHLTRTGDLYNFPLSKIGNLCEQNCVYLQTNIIDSQYDKSTINYWLVPNFDPGNFSAEAPKLLLTKHRSSCVVDVSFSSGVQRSTSQKSLFQLSVVQKLQLKENIIYQPNYVIIPVFHQNETKQNVFMSNSFFG